VRRFTSPSNRDPRLPPRSRSLVAGVGLVGVVGGIILLVLAVSLLSSFRSTAPGEVCVVQEGGPLDGRGERNYIISSRANEADSKTVDFVEVPTSDAVAVRIEGQALFRLTTDPAVLRDFYRRFGVRTFDGQHPYDGDSGWVSFLAIQFRPVLDNALREAIGQYRCEQLNNTCQYVQNANQAVSGKVKAVNTGQTLAQAQDAIARTLEADLTDTLGGKFFEGIKFRLRGVSFAPEVQSQITRAQATRTAVATARLDAQKRVEQAIGDRRVAEQRARAIRATRNAYRDNPSQARIDALKALPPGLQSLGGNTSLLLGGNNR
jgi:regulator of protease activity HflC (stomatin/prohibitin superfamily)